MGISDLEMNLITITGTNPNEFSQTTACSTVAKGGSCTITVTFSPASTGSKSSTMSIPSNDPIKPIINVKLSGKGIGGSVPPAVNITGSWNMYHTENGTPGEQGPDLSALTQTGNGIAGTVSGFTITGTISGLNISYYWEDDGGTITTLTGTVSSDGTAMSGTFTNSSGNSGTWRATKVPQGANYFPLEVGNKWIYSSFVQGAYRNDEIIGTEIINGSTTYIKERVEPAPDNYDEKRWLAYDSSSVLIFRIWGNEGTDPAIDFSPPGIEYKLSPQVGDEWSFGILNLGAVDYEVLSVNDTVTVPAGVFTKCIKIMVTETPSGKIHIKHYAPEVGMIRNEQPGEWVEELVYAKIGPKTYGVAP